ncbi:YbhB/YbcL family Raf kinase inhibitor-like protein [Janthinobacterium sp. LB2P49]|uniref:YbhB/YbcL family Raf kinase inhibitor-like protein n=1 Tax=Janthinobacterium sp. LB2P49 TaxID=3424198 RepID=UPI003F20386F
MTPSHFRAITLGLLSSLLHLGAHAAEFNVTSSDIAPDQTLAAAQVFQGFGCAGGNLSPQLSWHNAPAGTKSYAITLYDPDAPTGSGWWHWSVFNVPATTNSLPAGTTAATLPAGAVQGRNDFGDSAYGGACPPPGDKAHRYQITVWALSVGKLPLDQQASGAMLGYMLNANALGKAQLTGLYGR